MVVTNAEREWSREKSSRADSKGSRQTGAKGIERSSVRDGHN